MAKKWDFYCWDATGTRYGLMVCCSCGKKITEGEYRVRETKEAYITQHRSCSHGDPEWTRRDKELAAEKQREAELERDAKAFIAKWGYVDIEEYM